MKPKIILIAGEAESGKDTFADILIDFLSINFFDSIERYAFGDAVKKVARQEYHWNGEKDKKGRRILQLVGELYRKAFGKDYWIKRVSGQIRVSDAEIAVITDCRYPNESVWFGENGYDQEIIKIGREDYENNLTEEQRQHESESLIDEIDEDFKFSCKDKLDLNLSAKCISRIINERW